MPAHLYLHCSFLAIIAWLRWCWMCAAPGHDVSLASMCRRLQRPASPNLAAAPRWPDCCPAHLALGLGNRAPLQTPAGACKDFIAKYCRKVHAGQGRLAACLTNQASKGLLFRQGGRLAVQGLKRCLSDASPT